MLKSVYLSNDNIKVVRHLIIFFIIVFTFLMVIGNKYFIPKNEKSTNNNIEGFIPSFGEEKECESGHYCGHGGQVKYVGTASWSENKGKGGGLFGSGSGDGTATRKKFDNCNEEYEAQKEEGAMCPTPCAPGQDQAWAAGAHESQTEANQQLLGKYKDNLGKCLKKFVNIGGFISI